MLNGKVATLLCAASLALFCPQNGAAAEQFDIVIKSGRIVDGTGSPWYRGMSAFAMERLSASVGSTPRLQRR